MSKKAEKVSFVHGLLNKLADDYPTLPDFLSYNQEEAYKANEADVDKAVAVRLSSIVEGAFSCKLEEVGSLDDLDKKVFVDLMKTVLRQEINPFVKPTPIVWGMENLGATRTELTDILREGKTVKGAFTIVQEEKETEDGPKLVFQGQLIDMAVVE
ncbi:MAG: hypothetical protein GWN31_14905 [Candidatus Thorarchaeota archaeon]|nr:hypothetical protein [Candidatus Thorarchaeota archaeon]NIW15183.1 hypothetical protein [Candidatus Thorarchaeota archaeon]NIW53172.1 hypothetical protein [Candidatus Korarchaeota archaeon]